MKKITTTIAVFLLIVHCMQLFAQAPPLVYTAENTGAGYKLPVLPSLSELPVIEPLPDPFTWLNENKRSIKFKDWEHHRNEIKAAIENYEIGPKPPRPDSISASWIPGTTPTTGTLQVVVIVNGQTL